MTQSDHTNQRQVEAALIDAAGKLARSGKYSFDELVAKLSGAGFTGAVEFLHRPHLESALRRLCDAARPGDAELG
ncbi:MAG: hypothetical protein BroJett013_17830 [Alphaproteobacteria bacterium]|nr:MAG: hypothetical protein BroJett013_17830 [Alphaproteobacteria bacterium]